MTSQQTEDIWRMRRIELYKQPVKHCPKCGGEMELKKVWHYCYHCYKRFELTPWGWTPKGSIPHYEEFHAIRNPEQDRLCHELDRNRISAIRIDPNFHELFEQLKKESRCLEVEAK